MLRLQPATALGGNAHREIGAEKIPVSGRFGRSGWRSPPRRDAGAPRSRNLALCKDDFSGRGYRRRRQRAEQRRTIPRIRELLDLCKRSRSAWLTICGPRISA